MLFHWPFSSYNGLLVKLNLTASLSFEQQCTPCTCVLGGEVVLQVVQSGLQLGVHGGAEVLHAGRQGLGLHGQAAPLVLLPPLAHADPPRVARQVPGRLGPQVGGHVDLVLGAAAGRGVARLALQLPQSGGEEVDGAGGNGFGFFFGDGLKEGAAGVKHLQSGKSKLD